MQANMRGHVLIQVYDHVKDGKSKTTLHPVTRMSILILGSQLSLAALTKEVCNLYMSVKKPSF